jgi:putative membrane protein
MKEFFSRMACGVVIGIGCVLPGVSGGIMAVSMNLYERMVSALVGFFRAFKKNLIFLLPIVLGGGIGILLTSNVLNIVIERHMGLLLALFAGFVLGSIPDLVVEARGPEKRKFRVRHAAAIFCGLAFVLLFALGESVVSTNERVYRLNIPNALIAGGVLSVGTILPGISSSFILIYMGLYDGVLSALAGIFNLRTFFAEGFGAAVRELSAQIVPLLFMVIGFGAIAILLILGVNRALKRHHTMSYYAIIGFVIGSVALIFPGIIADFSWLSAPMFLLGFGVTTLQFFLKRRTRLRAEAALAKAAADASVVETPAAEALTAATPRAESHTEDTPQNEALADEVPPAQEAPVAAGDGIES